MTLPPFIVRVFLNLHPINPGGRAWGKKALILIEKEIHNRLILAPEFRVDLSQ
jgi:bifunctional pyridoxal-dependent enzyme with beta-cystathionase and maltose regulon repressor activities